MSTSISGSNSFQESTMKQGGLLLNDVICTQNRRAHSHKGNIKYQAILKSHQAEYLAAKRKDRKSAITGAVIKKVKDYGGRFVKFDNATKVWMEIGTTAEREKVSHALRSPNQQRGRKSGKAINQILIKSNQNMFVQQQPRIGMDMEVPKRVGKSDELKKQETAIRSDKNMHLAHQMQRTSMALLHKFKQEDPAEREQKSKLKRELSLSLGYLVDYTRPQKLGPAATGPSEPFVSDDLEPTSLRSYETMNSSMASEFLRWASFVSTASVVGPLCEPTALLWRPLTADPPMKPPALSRQPSIHSGHSLDPLFSSSLDLFGSFKSSTSYTVETSLLPVIANTTNTTF